MQRRLALTPDRVGVRMRLVLVAVVVVLLALTAGGGALDYLLQRNLVQTAAATATARAADVAGTLARDGLAATRVSLTQESRSGQFVQILTTTGRVVASSHRLVSVTPLSTLSPAPGRNQTVDRDIDGLGESEDWLVAARGVAAGTDRYVVQVAVPLRVQRQTVQTVAVFLLGTTPLLLVAVAAAVWVLVGRALGAVEQIRREVATIDATRLRQRVAVPASGDEVARLAETMNSMLDRLESADRAQRSFVSDASHELRSPLATLTTAAELAVSADADTRTQLLETIRAELERSRALVENLMTLARADTHNLLAERDDVDLDDLLSAEVDRLRVTSDKRVVLDGVEPVRIEGDAHRLAQALRNVVDNAERHATSAVRLALHTAGRVCHLCVDNDGPPIRDDDRDRVFERFVRLDDSRARDAGGTGLGLSIVRTVVEAHGGRVIAVEAPDGWCRFDLELPLQPVPATS